MARNHYVSQLIIRRFSQDANKINLFNVRDKRIFENRRSARVFFKQDIYSEQVEKKLNEKLEDPLAKLIDKKIIGKEEIVLNRKDLFLIKKFMLIDSVRTFTPGKLQSMISGFSSNAERYASFSKYIGDDFSNNLISIKDLNETSDDFFDRAMNLFIDANSLGDILAHPLSCQELYVWAKVFFDGYLAFWDSCENQEFILTDNGMTSEYEPSHIVYEGISISKLSYLLEKQKHASSEELMFYSNLLTKISFFYENFSVFNLSSTRCMVVIHPFFRLFNSDGLLMNGRLIKPDIPDVWPSFIETKNALLPPKNWYKQQDSLCVEDEFVYYPQTISLFDTIHINLLFLSQSHNLIGFSSFEKIRLSLKCHIMLRALNDKQVYEQHFAANITHLFNNVLMDAFGYMFTYYKESNTALSQEVFDYLDHYALMSLTDTRLNRYSLQYLLDNESKLRSMKNFDFMGSPDERVEMIRKDLENINRRFEKSVTREIENG